MFKLKIIFIYIYENKYNVMNTSSVIFLLNTLLVILMYNKSVLTFQMIPVVVGNYISIIGV